MIKTWLNVVTVSAFLFLETWQAYDLTEFKAFSELKSLKIRQILFCICNNDLLSSVLTKFEDHKLLNLTKHSSSIINSPFYLF